MIILPLTFQIIYTTISLLSTNQTYPKNDIPHRMRMIIYCPRERRPAGKKEEGKTLRTHQVMGSNPWEVVTPKMGNPGCDFGLVGSPKGAGHRRL